MDYQLLWAGTLWTVPIPLELLNPKETELTRWTYVQTYIASGGSHGAAMRQVLQQLYPGLGYGCVLTRPISVTGIADGSAVPEHVPSSSSKPGRSSPSFSSSNCSQRPTPHGPSPSSKHGGSGISGPRRPAPRFATSTAGRQTGGSVHRSVRPPPAGPPKTTRPASNGTGGWLGSKPTTVSTS